MMLSGLQRLRRSKVVKWIKGQITYQATSMDRVRLEWKWHEKNHCFYINSAAGLLIYKPKSTNDLNRFRDKWINKISVLFELSNRGMNIKKDIFELYHQVRTDEKIRYRSNLRTRLKCFLRVY